MRDEMRLRNLYYPNHNGTLWERLQTCWRILRYGEWFPAPRPWYEPLCRTLDNPIYECVAAACAKVELEAGRGKTTRAVKQKEVQEWACTYARERGYDPNIQVWFINFAREWWVLTHHDHFTLE